MTNEEFEQIEKVACLAIEDNTRLYGRSFAHSATCSTIFHLSTIDNVRPEQFKELVIFALDYLKDLVRDESIPWETTTAMFAGGAKRKKARR